MSRFFISLILCFIAFIGHCETYVVCVGIGNYASPKVRNLTKTESDAKAVAEFYKKGTKNVITITGKYATTSQVLKSLRDQFSRAKENDKIIFFFSGHGYPGGFCPYDMTNINGGIKYSEIINIMQQSQAKNKLIFADACHSGAIRQKQNVNNTPIKSGNVLFFLSSRGNEYSAENAFLANGYFTKNLLRGLSGGADFNRDKLITAKELFKFVSEGVKSQTNGKQHPVMWGKFDDNLTIVEYQK